MGTLGNLVYLLFPVVAGLHTYSVDYGYKGLDREIARYNACGTALGAALVSLILYGFKTFGA